jgi:predicted PurR-regulated permease PerM
MIGAPIMRLFVDRLNFKRWKYGPELSAMLTLLVFVIAALTLFSVFVPLVAQQARNLTEIDYVALGEALSEPINFINGKLYNWGIISEITEPSKQIDQWFGTIFNSDFLSGIFGYVLGLAGNALIGIFSVVFISFFFIREQGLFVDVVKALVPTNQEDKTVNAIEEISHLLTRYFGGIVIQVTIITIFVSLALSLIGVENALLIGFFAAIINVIPYVGPMIGAAFAVAVTISSNLDMEFYSQMMPLILMVVGVFLIMQLTDNFILQPFIFSNSVKAHPLEIFIIILVGAQLGGILGMVLAIPSYTVFRVIGKVFLSEFKIIQGLTSRMK